MNLQLKGHLELEESLVRRLATCRDNRKCEQLSFQLKLVRAQIKAARQEPK